MSKLIPDNKKEGILTEYHNTPNGLLQEYINLKTPQEACNSDQLFSGKCMDKSKPQNIPNNFSFNIRSSLKYSEFKLSFSIAIGKINRALTEHNNCGMVNLASRREEFKSGLIETAGCDKQKADEQFMHFASLLEIENARHTILSETKRFRLRYPKKIFCPFFYLVEDSRLNFIAESESTILFLPTN